MNLAPGDGGAQIDFELQRSRISSAKRDLNTVTRLGPSRRPANAAILAFWMTSSGDSESAGKMLIPALAVR
jgi:hypothetical protein